MVSTSDLRLLSPKIPSNVEDAMLSAAIADATLILQGYAEIVALDAGRVDAITKYMAAHLVSLSTGSLASRSLGDASDSFASSQFGAGLKSTVYGQRAILFDTTGTLAALGQGTVKFEVL